MALITKLATDIISKWEHGGAYTCHGNGAYGLIGFQGDALAAMLAVFFHDGGQLKHTPKWYADELVKKGKGINAELDKLAKTPLMKQTQEWAAEKYMARSIHQAQKHFPFKTPLAQLIICDMGVNNGIWNNYVKDAIRDYPRKMPHYHLKEERDLIMSAMSIRIKAMKDHGIWDRYAGIRKRYSWYQGLWKRDKALTMKVFGDTIKVNGYTVHLPKEIEVI